MLNFEHTKISLLIFHLRWTYQNFWCHCVVIIVYSLYFSSFCISHKLLYKSSIISFFHCFFFIQSKLHFRGSIHRFEKHQVFWGTDDQTMVGNLSSLTKYSSKCWPYFNTLDTISRNMIMHTYFTLRIIILCKIVRKVLILCHCY